MGVDEMRNLRAAANVLRSAGVTSRGRNQRRARTTMTTFTSLLLVYMLAGVTVAAAPASIEGLTVPITRTAGTCPTMIPVKIALTRYDGGATFDVTAQTMRAAYASKLLSATPQRIVFDADLRPAYASCEGFGRSKDGWYRFALHRGKLSYIVVPVKGTAANASGLLDVSVNGTPHVKMAFAD